MTQVLDRPSAAARRRSAPAERPAPLWLRSLLGAFWAASVGLAGLVVVSLVVWSADSRTTASAGSAMRFAVALWLDAQRVPLTVPGGRIALAPLGLTLLLGVLLARFAAVVARGASSQEPGAVAAMVFVMTLGYAGLATGLAYAGRTATIRPSMGAAFVTAGILSLIATTVGGLRGAGQWRVIWDGLPATLRDALRASGAAAAVLLSTSTVLAVAALFHHASLVGDSIDGYSNGSGRFAMAAVSLLLVPNAVLFTTAYLTGSGFAVGAGTSVSLTGAHVGATPALPILAALPRGAAPWPVVALAITSALGAGLLAGWRIRRDLGEDLRAQLRAVAATGVVIGAAAALLVALAGGPFGPGRLAAIGPSPWKVGLSLGGEVAGVALLAVAVQGWWRLWRSLPGVGRS
ncbi:MAG: cell division protein PerM [Mycobacteriales bacterium]